ncbi:MAG: hypothetical protein KJO21_08910 [Verrucomicrobiae bacterium]|nr:hypothetical protein [Verrucomicrobiae bacterium]NNJ42293.1 hypothetical protein [Akkermansiaceae bacterium]
MSTEPVDRLIEIREWPAGKPIFLGRIEISWNGQQFRKMKQQTKKAKRATKREKNYNELI